MPTLLIDSKIPYAHPAASLLGTVRYINGADIRPADLSDVDALVVRTRTRCGEALLHHTPVRYIATATIGYDHIDTHYLNSQGIGWTNCPGCNAPSVAQYVECALLQLAAHGCWDSNRPLLAAHTIVAPERYHTLPFAHLTLGIVGVGHVGREVEKMARRLGFGRILLCDPPRAESEKLEKNGREAAEHTKGLQFGKGNIKQAETPYGKERADTPPYGQTLPHGGQTVEKEAAANGCGIGGKPRFHPLEYIAREADIITFHTPLTHEPAPHPTYHMADAEFFRQTKPGAVVINAARGEVVDTTAIVQALQSHHLGAAVIDTWENEPHPSPLLLRLAYIATPHIAGYSADGKATGTRMALTAVARHFGIDPAPFDKIVPPPLPEDYRYYPQGGGWRGDHRLLLYDPVRDSLMLKARPDRFEALRGHYPLRREQ